MSQSAKPPLKSPQKQSRLQAALRRNLQRRKAQARLRQEGNKSALPIEQDKDVSH